MFAYSYGGDDYFSATYTEMKKIASSIDSTTTVGVLILLLLIALVVFCVVNYLELREIRKLLAKSQATPPYDVAPQSTNAAQYDGVTERPVDAQPTIEPASTPVETSAPSYNPEEPPEIDASFMSDLEKMGETVLEDSTPAAASSDSAPVPDAASRLSRGEFLDKLSAVKVDGIEYSPLIFINAAREAQNALHVDASEILNARDVFGILKAWPRFWKRVYKAGMKDQKGSKAIAKSLNQALKLYKALPKDPVFNP